MIPDVKDAGEPIATTNHVPDLADLEGKGYFLDFTKSMQQKYQTIRQTIEEGLTAQLADQMSDTSTGIGFAPTMRNILAVFFAQGEAFLRLMDDVHTKAWEQRDSKIRKGVIFDKQIANASADNKSSGDDKNQPVYPWPQVIKETTEAWRAYHKKRSEIARS